MTYDVGLWAPYSTPERIGYVITDGHGRTVARSAPKWRDANEAARAGVARVAKIISFDRLIGRRSHVRSQPEVRP